MSSKTSDLVPLTRNEMYALSKRCRDYAIELANHDQSRVSLRHCHEFNQWLPMLRAYDLLAPELRTLKGARPIARWQVMVVTALLCLLILVALPPSFGRQLRTVALYTLPLILFCVYLVPERLYGTTIELVEAKLLYIVELLEKQLQSGALEFTEAAFYRTKENLEDARQELRQQIDLAYRARRRIG